MSSIDCTACDNLRETSPEYVLNGTTSAICNSLKNDTGLNPNLSTLHTNAEDLHDINDCTIGRMAQEIEGYDVCDWKEFMQKYVPNNYELLKAMICSEDGQWQNIHDLWDFAREVCAKADQAIFPSGIAYGAFPYATNQNRVLGTINTKNGSPLLTVLPEADITPRYKDVAGPGIQISVQTLSRCSDGACRKYVRVEPWFYEVVMNANAEIGDIIWYAPIDEVVSKTGVPEEFVLDTMRRNTPGDTNHGGGWIWSTGINFTGLHKQAWMHLSVDPHGTFGEDYLVMTFEGTSYPVEAPGSVQKLGTDQGVSFKTYTYNC